MPPTVKPSQESGKCDDTDHGTSEAGATCARRAVCQVPNNPASAGDATLRAAGDQRRATRGLVPIEGDRCTVDAVGGAAFDDGEHALAQWAADHMANPGDRLAVDVGVAEGAEHLATVGGGIAKADDVFHGGTPCLKGGVDASG